MVADRDAMIPYVKNLHGNDTSKKIFVMDTTDMADYGIGGYAVHFYRESNGSPSGRQKF